MIYVVFLIVAMVYGAWVFLSKTQDFIYSERVKAYESKSLENCIKQSKARNSAALQILAYQEEALDKIDSARKMTSFKKEVARSDVRARTKSLLTEICMVPPVQPEKPSRPSLKETLAEIWNSL